MRKRLSAKGRLQARRGFSLTELAIVLGVASFVVGGIWVAAQSVYEGHREYKTVQSVGQIAQNIRDYYSGMQGIPMASCPGSSDLTAALDQVSTDTLGNVVGLFPSDVRSPCAACGAIDKFKIDTAYSGTDSYGSGIGHGSLRVLGSCASATSSIFRIVLMDLPPASCAKLLFSGIPYKDQTLGITSVCAASEPAAGAAPRPCYDGTAANWQSVTCANNLCDVTPANPTITMAKANALCAGSKTAEVGWEFKVRN